MATLSTDDFNRSNSSTLGTNWSEFSSITADGFSIASNACDVSLPNTNDTWAYRNGTTWPNDQWAQAKIGPIGSAGGGQGLGIGLRIDSGGAKTHYRVIIDHAGSNNVEIAKLNGGGYTQLGVRTQSFTDGDTLYAEVQSTTILCKLNGTQIGASVTDSAISTGNAGISFSSNETNATLDDWAGGDFAGQDTPELYGRPDGRRGSVQMQQLLAL